METLFIQIFTSIGVLAILAFIAQYIIIPPIIFIIDIFERHFLNKKAKKYFETNYDYQNYGLPFDIRFKSDGNQFLGGVDSGYGLYLKTKREDPKHYFAEVYDRIYVPNKFRQFLGDTFKKRLRVSKYQMLDDLRRKVKK